MKVFSALSKFFNRLTNVPSTDPDDYRRRKILNIILVGMVIATGITAIVTLIFSGLKLSNIEDTSIILITAIAALIGSLITYLLNRYWSGIFASTLFLIILTLLLMLADDPHELSSGRSTYLLSIPIIISSVLLGSRASLIFWGLVSIQLIFLARFANDPINIPAIMSLFFLGTISWLSSRNLEQALKDLRVVNAELDQRVVERTSELSAALTREIIEAGRREAILNSIADGVVVFDRNGMAILANPSISILINKPQKEIIGRGLNDLLDSSELKAGDRGNVAALLEKSAQDFSNFRVAWGKKTLSVNAAEVRDDNDRVIGTVAVFRDFTREAELEQMKNTFVAIVSHELRTPLNAILGYAEMLKEAVYGQINEKQQGVSVRIMTNTQRLLGIVSDLLDQAQIEAGRLKIQMVPCKPAELLDNMRGVMDKIASDKGLSLITELDPSMPSIIIGDPQRLQQIMVNLAGNAVKFSDKGSIYVKVFSYDKKSWRIQTIDSGNGIQEDALGYIFESFRQVEGASTRQHGGVGLGLSIVKQLVELMNGTIAVKTEIGKGSTFTVTLPLVVHEGLTIPLRSRQE